MFFFKIPNFNESTEEESDFCINQCGGFCCKFQITPPEIVDVSISEDGEFILNDVRDSIKTTLEFVKIVDDLVKYAALDKDDFNFIKAKRKNLELTYNEFIERKALQNEGINLEDVYFRIVNMENTKIRLSLYAIMSCNQFDDKTQKCKIYERRPGFCKRFRCSALDKLSLDHIAGEREVFAEINGDDYTKTKDIETSINKLKALLKKEFI